MSLVLPHRDANGKVDSVQVWRFKGTPACRVCDGRGWRQVPRNMRLDAKPFALVDLELRECATCAGTGDAPATEAVPGQHTSPYDRERPVPTSAPDLRHVAPDSVAPHWACACPECVAWEKATWPEIVARAGSVRP